eukprot:CAMPEP_0195604756 /NCGR_PEP_ID=MMETSP0815-20121206/6807_1 /TAXON_ID=97485 /ORGANISM="Prymnesium parvum, Strain Texoma1" /LENGTH=500 /DNA_ID=CAMNT_0040744423 /DNA_START=54 /DNA_END=1556 /DNA_ORIENTATION=-
MGRKGKKIQQDDWESEVDAIAQENAESAYDGVALESLFAKLLAAGVVSESDYDRATDELASGVKSERQLMLEWEKKTCRKDEAATADQQAAELGSSGNLKDESAAPSDDALSETMQQSERHIEAWRRAAKSDPMQLPLARMTAVCLSGTYGVSTHADRNVRLWDSATGRRLGAHQHKLELTACCAREECVAVGDAAGMVHIYDTESEFVPLRLTGGSGAVRSIELLRVEGGTLVLGSGEATLTAWFTNTDGSPASRAVPLNFALKGLHLSAGPSGCVYGASRSLVTLYDLNASAAAWRAGGGEWPVTEPVWRGCWAASTVASVVDAFPGSTACVPSRPLSYSPFWKLLASAHDEAVALWDVRAAPEQGPAAVVRAAGGSAWVHLDEGQGMAGHLLIAPQAGGCVQLYDVRRLSASRGASAVHAIVTLEVPPSEGAVCFAAKSSTLVVGGVKCSEAWRYDGVQSQKPEGASNQEPRTTPPARSKPKRQVSTAGRRMFNRTK